MRTPSTPIGRGGAGPRVLSVACALACACSDSSGRSEPPRADPKAALDARPEVSPDQPLPFGKVLPLPDSPHWYRVTLRRDVRNARAGDESLPEIPFFVWIPPGDDATRAVIANGDQRFEAERAWRGDEVTIQFPLYHTRLDLKRFSDGVLRGEWQIASPTWGTASLPLRATHVGALDPARRFLPLSDRDVRDPVDPGGAWYVTFDKSKPAQLELTPTAPGVVTGIFEFSTGDIVYTAGNVFGDRLYLSGFDGTTPYLVVAALDATVTGLSGTWVAGPDLGWRESMLGYRGARDISLETPKLALGQDELHLPELSGPRYRDKPVVVELAGSWCTACNAASPVLRALYERYQPQGLEMVTYLYEFTDDAAYNRQQASEFKARNAIPWEVIAVDGTIDDFDDLMPIEITDFNDTSFPIAVFVNADAGIYDIQAGFPGPEAGEPHRRVVAKYDRRMRALIERARAARAAPPK